MTTLLVAKKEPTQPNMTEKKLAGLIKRQPNKVSYILQIEKLWESYALNRTDCLKAGYSMMIVSIIFPLTFIYYFFLMRCFLFL